jgi:phosphotriesterase-related protein
MTTVNSVLGGIESEDLGFTLMHEHILIANPAMRQAFADWVDVDAVMDFAVAELVSARERGVRTVVDLTPINLGRDIQVIEEVARRAEVQIVAATGYYWTEEAWLVGWEVDQIVEKTIREITDGIAGTSIKAGIIKCATDHAGVTPVNDKLLRVAARLHRNTGVPISTHTEVNNRSGLAQQEVFEEEGVDLRRVVIGHCGDSKDLDYLEAILARGSFIGMDRFGVEMLLPTESRVATVAELCRRGYAGQMVLSHDACCHMDFFPDMNVLRQFAQLWNFRHIPDDILPALRKEGVSEEQIRSMTVDNPRRVFEQHGTY